MTNSTFRMLIRYKQKRFGSQSKSEVFLRSIREATANKFKFPISSLTSKLSEKILGEMQLLGSLTFRLKIKKIHRFTAIK